MRKICVLFLFGWLLVACQAPNVQPTALAAVTPTPTFPAVATATPHPTQTSLPTVTRVVYTPPPTHTATVSSTPSPTLPTLDLKNPSTPVGVAADYQLKRWTAEEAHYLTKIMEKYLDGMRRLFLSGVTADSYYQKTFYPALAYQEAFLRYPADSRAHQWQLAGVINHSLNPEGSSDQLYPQFLLPALNSGQLLLTQEQLTAWFSQTPAEMEVRLELIPGRLNQHLLTLLPETGAVSFIIVEQDEQFTSYPIYNDLGNAYLHYVDTQWGDLTGDGQKELLLTIGTGSGNMIGGETYIYDVSQLPAVELTFGPQPLATKRDMVFKSLIAGPQGETYLELGGGNSFGCLDTVTSQYGWNGQWLEQLTFEATFRPEHPVICVDSAAFYLQHSRYSTLERQGFLRAYEQFVGDIPLMGTNFQGEPFAPDAQDKMRLMLAMSYLSVGDMASAQNYLNRIIHTPAMADSTWVEPAQVVLAEYQTITDSYSACLLAGELCPSLKTVLPLLGPQIPLTQFSQAIQLLTEWGVPVVEQGEFDIDQDGQREQWFTVRPRPVAPLELWLVTASNTHIKLLFVAEVQTSPLLASYRAEKQSLADNQPAAFTIGDGGAIFQLVRHTTTAKPFLASLYPTDFLPPSSGLKQYQAWMEALLAGADPAEVLAQLLAAAENPAFENSHEYEYFLGLTYELLGEEEKAVEAYFKAWQNCCDTFQFGPNEGRKIIYVNGFSLMAQAKLEKRP